MIIPNIIALFWLFKKAKGVIVDYNTQIRSGIKDPVYDWNKFRAENGLELLDE